MADNITINSMAGGDTVSADDLGAGLKVQRVKVQHGADGSATDVSAASPMPVNQTDALPAGDNNIGNVDVASALPAGDNNIGNVDIASALPAGTNAIGKLAANSGVDIGDVDVTSAPARAATTDAITAKLATDALQNGLTALTPKFAVIDNATSGDNTIVAAVNPKKIRVLSCYLVASAAVTVRFESGAGGTALSGQMQLAANGGFVLPFNPLGWFETASNTLLNLELSGAVSVDGGLVYVEV